MSIFIRLAVVASQICATTRNFEKIRTSTLVLMEIEYAAS